MVMFADQELGTEYLTVGLFAQRLIDKLIDFADASSEEGLDSCLTEALEILKGESAAAAPGTPERQARGLHSYERARTLEEVDPTAQGKKETIRALEELLQRKGGRKQQILNAEKAIKFLYRLENRALRNFDQPFEPPPAGLRELCKVP
jgi:hypothetical protein